MEGGREGGRRYEGRRAREGGGRERCEGRGIKGGEGLSHQPLFAYP